MISKLHYITQEVAGFSHLELAEQACVAGADWVQLRLKNRSQEEILAEAKDLLKICKKHKARLIINDHVAIAKTIGADGVHLGKNDMSILEARKILGENFIIGATANTLEDILEHTQNGANYIGLGPYKFTHTKEKLSPVLGLEGYKKIIAGYKTTQPQIPIIAIGGIEITDVSVLLETGVYGIALASTINYSANKALTIKEIIEILYKGSEAFINTVQQ